ncbi:hypothetical protein WCLP8_1750015 [uncultured Gammaproteobacteria bacterium]
MPHIPHEELVLPADVQGRRAPGQIGPDSMTMAYQRKVEAGRRKFALTLEYLRMGALKGIIVGGSGKTLYNLYTTFGITQKSVDFALGTDSTDIDAKINEVLRHIEDNLLGERGHESNPWLMEILAAIIGDPSGQGQVILAKPGIFNVL